MDTVIAVRDGFHRYLFACLNLRSRFGLVVATPGMSSRWARDFADLALDLFPGPVDRGSPTTARSTKGGSPTY